MLAIVFAVALAVTLAATPLVGRLSRRSGRVAAPSPDRWHAEPTALFGGVAIAAGFAGAILVGFFEQLISLATTSPALHTAPVLGVLTAAMLMFAAGFTDDLFALRAPTKLVLQFATAALLVSFGVTFQITPWLGVNIFATFVWFIAITNALNLLDNMDGVAAGVAAIAGAGFAALFAAAGLPGFAAIGLALAGACVGFLAFNFQPARIFMGDCGSLLIGSLLASLGAVYSMSAPVERSVAVLVPLLLVCVPLIDTGLVSYARLVARQPLTVGGRDHTSHRMVQMGLSERAVAVTLYLMAAVGAALAFAVAQDNLGIALWAAAPFGVGAAMFAAYMARQYTYPPTGLRPTGKWWFLIEDLLYRRRLLEVALDLILFAAAYWGAFLLRWDGFVPQDQQEALARSLALAMVAKSVSFVLLGVYRGIWQQVSVADVHRLVRAVLLGAVFTAAAVSLLLPGVVVPRSIFLIDALLVVLLAFGVRLTFRSLDRARQSLAPRGTPTLIYGAGAAGDLALRELLSNPNLGLLPLGFLDDDPRKAGGMIHGLPVHFAGDSLERLLDELGVRQVLVGTRALGLPQSQRLRHACKELGIDVYELRLEIVEQRGSGMESELRGESRSNINLA